MNAPLSRLLGLGFIYESESLMLASKGKMANKFRSRNAFHGFIDADMSSYKKG